MTARGRRIDDTMLEDVNQALGLGLQRNIHHIKEMIYLIIRKAFQITKGCGELDVISIVRMPDIDVTYKAEALFQDAVVDFKKVNKINHIGRVTSQIEEKTGCIS
uniref:Late blight resistance protein n=1 Tax=Solanum tuberosum TaxID=4113 RepID=M1D3A7_SOLTU